MAFNRGDRTYYVSDERLRAFQALPVAERLRWVEELALFLHMARKARTEAGEKSSAPDSKYAMDAATDKGT